jgi:hypothetical protein
VGDLEREVRQGGIVNLSLLLAVPGV